MTSLILALALTGQQCQIVNGRQVCSPAPVYAPVYGTAYRTSVDEVSGWRRYVVKIRTFEGREWKVENGRRYLVDVIGWGSGIIIQSDGQTAVVLTNKHVLDKAQSVAVWHPAGHYAANIIQIAPEDDIAALEIKSPVGRMQVPIATDGGGHVTMLGFDGPSGQFHVHSPVRQTAYPSQEYRYVTHQGESGAPLLNERGQLLGLAWGSDGRTCTMAVTFPAIRAFLNGLVRIGRFLRPPPASTGTTIVQQINARNYPVAEAVAAVDTSLIPPPIPMLAQGPPPSQLPVPDPAPKQLPSPIFTPVLPSPQNPIGAAPMPMMQFPALKITGMKNGKPQKFLNGMFASRIYRPIMTMDPNTGRPILAYDIGVETDILLSPGSETGIDGGPQ